MEFRIQKKDALAALLASLDLSQNAASKVTARLTFLGRTGFPAGVNTGRGFRGGYSLDQFWQIVLLFHLQRVGIGLAPAIALIGTSWPLASSAITLSFKAPNELGSRFYWVIRPAPLQGLEEFQVPNSDELDGSRIQTIAVGEGEAFQNALPTELGSHFCIINATAVVEKALSAFREAGDGELMRDLEHAHRQQQSATAAVLRDALRSRS